MEACGGGQGSPWNLNSGPFIFALDTNWVARGMSGFVQSCVLCGSHRKFLYDPRLTPCTTCGAPYCRSCYNGLPKVKVGLFRSEPRCPRCAYGSAAARAPYTPYAAIQANQMPQPTAPPPPAVFVQDHTKEIIKEVVKIPCSYCGALRDQTWRYCMSCGAPHRGN